MITSTTTITIQRLTESYDDRSGIKIVSGECTFNYRDRNEVQVATIPFKAKGFSAIVLSTSGQGSCGIAIGYFDVDERKKYTLVIRQFQPLTVTPQTTSIEKVLA